METDHKFGNSLVIARFQLCQCQRNLCLHYVIKATPIISLSLFETTRYFHKRAINVIMFFYNCILSSPSIQLQLFRQPDNVIKVVSGNLKKLLFLIKKAGTNFKIYLSDYIIKRYVETIY